MRRLCLFLHQFLLCLYWFTCQSPVSRPRLGSATVHAQLPHGSFRRKLPLFLVPRKFGKFGKFDPEPRSRLEEGTATSIASPTIGSLPVWVLPPMIGCSANLAACIPGAFRKV